MHPAIESQVDASLDSEKRSAEAAKGDWGESLTRQEQAADTDINNIIQKFGPGLFNKQPIFGSIDFDRNLQDAYTAIESAQRLWASMPDQLRKKFNSQESMTEALFNGDLEKAILEELNRKEEPAAPPDTPPEVTP